MASLMSFGIPLCLVKGKARGRSASSARMCKCKSFAVTLVTVTFRVLLEKFLCENAGRIIRSLELLQSGNPLVSSVSSLNGTITRAVWIVDIIYRGLAPAHDLNHTPFELEYFVAAPGIFSPRETITEHRISLHLAFTFNWSLTPKCTRHGGSKQSPALAWEYPRLWNATRQCRLRLLHLDTTVAAP